MPVAKKFIDRPEDMQSLRKALLRDQSNRRKIFVLRGLGGIGKTQLAVEFMRQYQKEFTAIFWLNGSSEDSLKQSLAKQVGALPLQNSEARDADTARNVNKSVQEVLTWLAASENSRWLLVFDNVDRKFQSSDPLSYDIKEYFPAADHGAILITTRLSRLEQLGGSREVQQVDKVIAKSILDSWYKAPCGKIAKVVQCIRSET